MSTTITPELEQDPPRRSRRRVVIGVVVAVLVVVALAVGGILYFFRGDAPDEVDLQDAAASITSVDDDDAATEVEASTASTVAAAAAAVDAADAATTTAAAAADAAAVGIAGTWNVDTSIGEFDDENSTGTFVGFRIDEELSGIGSTTAVGRTPDVTGSITIDGTTLTAATIEADMATITTNDSRRDDKVQSALETGDFPTATFVLTAPVELGDAAATGAAVDVQATGDLTIHGVTTSVTLPLQAQLVDGIVVVVGSVDITFADYGVSVPSSPIVVSAEDTGTLELQLFLQPA
jgi:polyisoprenoid-binding protein YceI